MSVVYIRDAYSHSTANPTVLGAARMKDGTLLVYVRRAVENAGQFSGYLFHMFARDAFGMWRSFKKPPGLVKFIANEPVGTVGRASGYPVESVSFNVEVPNRCIDVEPPAEGWNWQKPNLSERERCAVARNLGPLART